LGLLPPLQAAARYRFLRTALPLVRGRQAQAACLAPRAAGAHRRGAGAAEDAALDRQSGGDHPLNACSRAVVALRGGDATGGRTTLQMIHLRGWKDPDSLITGVTILEPLEVRRWVEFSVGLSSRLRLPLWAAASMPRRPRRPRR